MTAHKQTIASIQPVVKGGYRARLAQTSADLRSAQQLRHDMFVGPRKDNDAIDSDHFDALCQHVLIEDVQSGALQSCFRIMHFDTGSSIGKSYSAQFYDLTRLSAYSKPMIEIGRFCTAPYATDPNILRLGWAVLTRYVDTHNISMLFGCSSFPGNDLAPFTDTLSLLQHRHVAPPEWAPQVKAPETDPFAMRLANHKPTLKAATAIMPSLLRTYLSMGGWVSDHAVIDRQLDTFHVFTGVEIAKIPPRRAELLRADAR
jgi:putative hemolysin